mmetsp:Transcript_65892/g.208536  ORF Transcript_65892/g.208536 Transcript_65892/m.208536 type:complete len:122 (-) Transcript_65892:36-401(-)
MARGKRGRAQRITAPGDEPARMGRGPRTIYVGNLPGDVREREIEDLFYKYGRIVEIDLKLPPRPPGYAFIEFSDERDAEDAVRGRDGYDFGGARIRVRAAPLSPLAAAPSCQQHRPLRNMQ